jgi:hypothetical protein
MGYGDVNTAFPENLRDPTDGDPAAIRFQDLFLAFSERVDLGLFAVLASGVRTASDLAKISGDAFEIVRISQCES